MAKKKICVIACEASGDYLGAKIVHKLKETDPNAYQFIGLGGQHLEKEGIKSLFPISDVAVMGIFEVLPHIYKIYKRIQETVDYLEKEQPDLVITIDSLGFCKAVIKRLKKRISPKFVHIVAPQVWAWRPKRAQKCADLFDHLFCLFPFEVDYFKPHGLSTEVFGHPLFEEPQATTPESELRQNYHIDQSKKIVTLMPGSRQQELNYHLPVLKELIEKLQNKEQYHFFLPVTNHHKSFVSETIKDWPVQIDVSESKEKKHDYFQMSNAALVCSGTATLEVALHKVPLAVFYKTNKLTLWLARQLVKIKHVSLVNIICEFGGWLKNSDIHPVKEYIGNECNAENLETALIDLLDPVNEDTVLQQSAFQFLGEYLKTEGQKPPSEIAAEKIRHIIKTET